MSRFLTGLKKKFIKTVRSRSGFSLGELLVTVMIIGLVTSAIAGGSGVIRNVYRNITVKANAEVAESTAITALQNTMRYAGSYDSKSKTFIDMNSGYRMRIYNSGGNPSRVYIRYYSPDDLKSADASDAGAGTGSTGAAVTEPLIPDAEFGTTLGSSLEMYIVPADFSQLTAESLSGDAVMKFAPAMDANGTFTFGLVVVNHDRSQNTYTVMTSETVSIHSMNAGS